MDNKQKATLARALTEQHCGPVPKTSTNEVCVLTAACWGLARIGDFQAFHDITNALFNLGFALGREDAKLDLWRED